MDKTYIDQQIKEQLEGYEGYPPGVDRAPEANWKRLEGMLEEDQSKPVSKWSWLAAAAVIVVLAVFGVARTGLSGGGEERVKFTGQTDSLGTEEEWLTVVEANPRNEALLYQVPRPREQSIPVINEPTATPSPQQQPGVEDLREVQKKELEFRGPAPSGSGKMGQVVENRVHFQSFASSAGKKNEDPAPPPPPGTYTVTSGLANGSIATEKPQEQTGTESGYFSSDRNKNIDQTVEGLKWSKSLDLPSPGPRKDDMEWTNGESYTTIIENAFMRPFEEPLSTFSIDVDHASYSNVRRFIMDGYAPQPNAVRIEEMVNYFDYDYKAPPADGIVPFNLISEISDCPWTAGNKLVHLGIQGRNIETEDLPPSNLVFLIDVSGSMSSYDKLPLLKESFALLIEQLRPQDRVSLVVYAGAAGVVLQPTPGDKKGKILKALEGLEFGGSTAGGEGIELAYKLARENFMKEGNNRVILATDGDFNVGISSESGLENLIEERRKDGVFLSILGFGTGNYQDSKMQTLADKGNGNHYYIDNLMEAKKTLVTEFGGTLYTIAKDVKIQVEFNPALVSSYRLIGYENRMLEAEDFDNDAIDAGELGAGHTVTALYEIVPAEEGLSKDEAGLLTGKAMNSHEWLSLKLRYKEPDGASSKLIRKPLKEAHQPLATTSDNFRWSAAVAGFGLLLRNSQFKGKANYDLVLELAEGAKGADSEGYREEFIKLVKTMKLLDNMQAFDKEYQNIWGN